MKIAMRLGLLIVTGSLSMSGLEARQCRAGKRVKRLSTQMTTKVSNYKKTMQRFADKDCKALELADSLKNQLQILKYSAGGRASCYQLEREMRNVNKAYNKLRNWYYINSYDETESTLPVIDFTHVEGSQTKLDRVVQRASKREKDRWHNRHDRRNRYGRYAHSHRWGSEPHGRYRDYRDYPGYGRRYYNRRGGGSRTNHHAGPH